jgi:hypothetical protein
VYPAPPSWGRHPQTFTEADNWKSSVIPRRCRWEVLHDGEKAEDVWCEIILRRVLEIAKRFEPAKRFQRLSAMQMFINEVIARFFGVFICYQTWFTVKDGLTNRQIRVYNPSLMDWQKYPDLHRDTQPIRYWMTIVIYVFICVAGVLTIIFGW